MSEKIDKVRMKAVIDLSIKGMANLKTMFAQERLLKGVE